MAMRSPAVVIHGMEKIGSAERECPQHGLTLFKCWKIGYSYGHSDTPHGYTSVWLCDTCQLPEWQDELATAASSFLRAVVTHEEPLL